MDIPSAKKEMVDRPYKASIIAELIELDRDVMKLLVRRAKLVGKLRGGKEHAATPAASRAEKEVRAAWEKNAVSFSRDDKFVRQLFFLLQEIRVDSRVESESRSGFNLAPARKAVAVDIPGLLFIRAARMLASLAAWLNSALVLENVAFADPLMDCVKAFNTAGANFSWTVGARPGEGKLTHTPSPTGAVLATDRALYVGEDLLTMYLMAFLAASRTGRVRFTGGSGLKMADLSPLRRFLPTLGARFAHSVPKSSGLPAIVEASGMLPEHVELPADLPYEGVVALLCAAAAWKRTVLLDCSAIPPRFFTAALAECLPVLRACSVRDTVEGRFVTLDARDVAMPESGAWPMDPLLAAYILSLPVFAGGAVRLTGLWDGELPVAGQAVALLARYGLVIQTDADEVRVELGEMPPESDVAPDLREMDADLAPLAVALAARRAWKTRSALLPLLPHETDAGVVEGFAAHLGLAVRDGRLVPDTDAAKGGATPAPPAIPAVPWTSPSAAWAFAYALCAYDRPNIRLSNPAVAATRMPSFWSLFNALPDPSESRKVVEKQNPPRRRIITE